MSEKPDGSDGAPDAKLVLRTLLLMLLLLLLLLRTDSDLLSTALE